MEAIIIFCLFVAILPETYGLQCYECTNVETSSSLSILSGKSNPGCTKEDFRPSSASQVSCRSGQKCGLSSGSVTANFPLFGSTTFKVDVRGCMSISGGGDGCASDDQNFKDTLKVLNFIAQFSDMQVDGEVCVCSGNLCDPGCGRFSVTIGGKCVSVWIFVGVGGGVLLLLILLCCCCCACCCACCKSKPAATTVVMHYPVVQGQPMNPVQTPATNPLGNTATNDPGYGYDQYPKHIV